MATKSLSDLLRERSDILLTADDILAGNIKKTETSLWRRLLNWIRRFTVRGGRIIQDEATFQILAGMRREINDIVRTSPLFSSVQDFLPNFDQVELLQNQIYGRILPNFNSLPRTSVAKRLAVERIVGALGELNALTPVFTDPLIQRMFFAVQSQVRLSEAERILSDYIRGTQNQKGGVLSRYASQIATDLLNGYDGYIQAELQKKFDLTGFFYSGSLIATSRPNCIHLVNGNGWFEDLAIRPGLYPTTATNEIVRRAAQPTHNSGWRPETTAATFPIYRCGFRCRHSLLYTDLTQREMNEFLSRAQRDLSRFNVAAV